VGADDRLMRDFLESELLAVLGREDLFFLTRTSILEQLSGPLCDAVLGESGSGAELDHLQRENLFLVPLDGHGGWYRYHPVFRELLRTRLERDDGDAVPDLLRRAADWCERDDRLEAALRYAREAGDVDRVARIAIALAQPMYAAGRADTVLGWLEWLAERGATEGHPTVAALGGYFCALTGRPAAADRWADLAERCAAELPAAREDRVFVMWLATLRGMTCRRGVEQMRRDVEEPVLPGGATAADPEYPMRLLISGIATMLLGDPETADARLTDAVELADGTRRPTLSCAALTHRALLCLAREDWSGTEDLVREAVALTRRARLESHVSSGLVFALAARVALQRGDPALARARLGEAQRVRPLLTHALPTLAVESLLQMAEASLGLGDPRGAGVLVRDADAVLRRRPDLGSLRERTDQLRSRLDSLPADGGATPTLTAAELRILPLLRTHLTLAGIAERLFLSRHTVKSQLWSAYQKLGVHTRAEAVARAQELGLLEA
jgi:LuxR family maltose regulon positive regulatory protein